MPRYARERHDPRSAAPRLGDQGRTDYSRGMIGQRLRLEGRDYEILRLLGKGKSGHSWLVRAGEALFVYKKMHDETVEHYEFGNKTMDEVRMYERLLPTGVPLPRLVAWSDEEQWLLKEYADGPTAAELAASEALGEEHWRAILGAHLALKAGGWHVDYFPANFVWSGGRMVLVDYEGHPYAREWDFPNWGIFYWLNAEGMREHLATGSSPRLNLPGRPKPVWRPFLERRDAILAAAGLPPEPEPESVWTR